jgi:hypothetical protein
MLTRPSRQGGEGGERRDISMEGGDGMAVSGVVGGHMEAWRGCVWEFSFFLTQPSIGAGGATKPPNNLGG